MTFRCMLAYDKSFAQRENALGVRPSWESGRFEGMSIYQNTVFSLERDCLVEGNLRATVDADGRLTTAKGITIDTDVSETFPHLSSDCSILDAMYGIAIRDQKRLVIEPETYFYMLCNRYGNAWKISDGLMPSGPVFWAGYGFPTYLYTRDTAFSSMLGTAHILPDVVASHLKHLRGLRRKVGLKVSRNHEIPIAGIPTEQLDISEMAFAQRYNTNCYTRRTDDVVWVLGLWEVYLTSGDEDLLEYILQEFDYFDEHFYQYFLDPADGLYRGQPTFIDVATDCYLGRGPSETILLKALSTNCMYLEAFHIVARIARQRGYDDLGAAMEDRAEYLKNAIRQSFGSDDYPFYKFEDGTYSDRKEILGLAFVVLFDVVSKEEGAQLLARYHDGDYGRPLFWPFYGSDRVYHDNSTWPFAEAFFALAEYKLGHKKSVIRKLMARLCRHGLQGDFNEVLERKSGAFAGCPGYLWSSAAFLALVYKMIAGVCVNEPGRVRFAPVLPEEVGSRFALSGLQYGKMIVDLHLAGNGEHVVSCCIDGREVTEPCLVRDDGRHCVEIVLGHEISDGDRSES